MALIGVATLTLVAMVLAVRSDSNINKALAVGLWVGCVAYYGVIA